MSHCHCHFAEPGQQDPGELCKLGPERSHSAVDGRLRRWRHHRRGDAIRTSAAEKRRGGLSGIPRVHHDDRRESLAGGEDSSSIMIKNRVPVARSRRDRGAFLSFPLASTTSPAASARVVHLLFQHPRRP
jgi:hypothetical protein